MPYLLLIGFSFVFQESVDEYLAWCEERGKEPDRPFSGKFVVRVSPELHRSIFLSAKHEGKSLNHWIEEHLSNSIHSQQENHFN